MVIFNSYVKLPAGKVQTRMFSALLITNAAFCFGIFEMLMKQHLQ